MAHQMGVLRHLEGGTAHQADFTRWRNQKVDHAPGSHSYMPKVLLNLQRDLRALTGEGPLPELGAVRAVLEGIDRCVCGTPGGLCGDSPPAEIRHLVRDVIQWEHDSRGVARSRLIFSHTVALLVWHVVRDQCPMTTNLDTCAYPETMTLFIACRHQRLTDDGTTAPFNLERSLQAAANRRSAGHDIDAALSRLAAELSAEASLIDLSSLESQMVHHVIDRLTTKKATGSMGVQLKEDREHDAGK